MKNLPTCIMHYAAGSQTSNSNNCEFETKFVKNLGYESGPKMDTFDEKKPEL
jgi:hypothetical protein